MPGPASPAIASVVFPRRVITRAVDRRHARITTPSRKPPTAKWSGTAHFALHWRAHGLGYGIPASIAADLAAGRNVVVNVSRAVLDEARRRFPPVTVVSVTVPPEILAERLRRRNREAEDDIAGRLARAGAYGVAGPDVVALDNSGSIAAAGAVLAAIIADRSPDAGIAATCEQRRATGLPGPAREFLLLRAAHPSAPRSRTPSCQPPPRPKSFAASSSSSSRPRSSPWSMA